MKVPSIAFTSALALHVAAAAGLSTLGRGHSSHGTHVEDIGTTIDVDQPSAPDTTIHEDVITTAIKGVETHASRGAANPVHVITAAATATATGDVIVDPPPVQTPTHFKMSVAAQVGSPSGIASPSQASARDEIVSDSDVTVRAKNISGSEPTYPADALARGIELDTPLAFEIVVDTSGRVIDARALSHAGHGFDEAALGALRTYRFTPAARNGQPVNVRMKWTIDFHFKS